MLSKLKDILWVQHPRPELEQGEEIVLEGIAVLIRGLVGERPGPIILTNRRIIWYEPVVGRPLKPISGQVKLSDIVSVDKGTLLDFIGGGRRLRLRLRSGKDKCLSLIEGEGRLDEWIAAIRLAVLLEELREGRNP